MKELTSRERILKNVRTALLHKTKDSYVNVDFESPIYKDFTEIKEINFAKEFTENGGKFIFCENESEAIENLKYLAQENNWSSFQLIDKKLATTLQSNKINIDTTNTSKNIIYTAESLVARTGTVVLSSKKMSNSSPNDFNYTIIWAYTSQIIDELKDALQQVKDRYVNELPAALHLISGIEKDQENKDLYLFLVDDISASTNE